MLEVWMVVLSFLAAYGVVQMILKAVSASRANRGTPPICRHRVVGVKDAEDSVEGLLRSLLWENGEEEFVVIDFGSADETPEILLRLSEQYPNLHIAEPREYIAYLEQLKEN